jgi:hypothetical protein
MSKDKPGKDQKKVAVLDKTKVVSSYKMEGQSKAAAVVIPMLKR